MPWFHGFLRKKVIILLKFSYGNVDRTIMIIDDLHEFGIYSHQTNLNKPKWQTV